ncbi:MAG: UDP-N-acetylmuramoyl-tripeptide--D-alanyl-D-alanine ligase [Bacteroidaceae bacterium]|nr:UDP-N-acetylmuramoyl-tripeptide--D-alanyl-D-alanine ligase [Bacteroidaceae bacterium]
MKIETLYDIYCQHPEVTTDSRRVPEGSMFFALKGESFDGNRFAAKALEAGAAAVVVDDAAVVPDGDERYLLVHDVLKALQDLAAYHRQQFHGPVVQVTGTNGKTTTKELIAAVLSERFSVLYTQGNLNNHIGVPLTLLRLRPGAHDIAIIETGANHPGEIAFLARIVDPDYGLITNVGRAHIEGFGSFEGVKRTKGELYDYLHAKPSARIFINESNYDLQDMLVKRDIDIDTDECITYAREQALTMAWVCEGDVLDCNPMLRLWWRPKYDGQHEVQTRLIGAYNIDNVLSAVAIGLHFGVAPEAIDHALATYQPSLGRSEYRRTEHNELIVDAYNANLTSMQAALDNFRRISHPLKMVILGDMKELGAVSDDAHRQIAAQALGSDLQAAWFVGTEFRKAISALAPADTDTDIRCFETVEDVKAALSDGDAPAGRLILIKGSNSTKLHQLPDFL